MSSLVCPLQSSRVMAIGRRPGCRREARQSHAEGERGICRRIAILRFTTEYAPQVAARTEVGGRIGNPVKVRSGPATVTSCGPAGRRFVRRHRVGPGKAAGSRDGWKPGDLPEATTGDR
jgi:hypothetical protein